MVSDIKPTYASFVSGASRSVIMFYCWNNARINKQHGLCLINLTNNRPCFRFGKGDQVATTSIGLLPVMWHYLRSKLKMHVMNEDMPFLVGIEVISKLGLFLGLKQKTVFINKTKQRESNWLKVAMSCGKTSESIMKS